MKVKIIDLKTLCQKTKLVIMNSIFFCHNGLNNRVLHMWQDASASGNAFGNTNGTRNSGLDGAFTMVQKESNSQIASIVKQAYNTRTMFH